MSRYIVFDGLMIELLAMIETDCFYHYPTYQEIFVRIHTGNSNQYWSDRICEQIKKLHDIVKHTGMTGFDLTSRVKTLYTNRMIM